MAYAKHPAHALCAFLHDLLAGEGVAADEIDQVIHAAFDGGGEAAVEGLVARLRSAAKCDILRDAGRLAGRFGQLSRRKAA